MLAFGEVSMFKQQHHVRWVEQPPATVCWARASDDPERYEHCSMLTDHPTGLCAHHRDRILPH